MRTLPAFQTPSKDVRGIGRHARAGVRLSVMTTKQSGQRTRRGPRRDRDAQEQLRLRAAELFARQVPQAEVARELGTDRRNVSHWYRRWQQGGVDALRSRGPTGRSPRVSAEQLAEVEQVLLAGARASGFANDLWTLARVARVIEQHTGIRHHPGHVWRLLRALGWSVQRPARRASERDDAAVEQWVKVDWPRIKKGQPAARQ
jgi:transposase